jgi:hypothetical protein
MSIKGTCAPLLGLVEQRSPEGTFKALHRVLEIPIVLLFSQSALEKGHSRQCAGPAFCISATGVWRLLDKGGDHDLILIPYNILL